MVHSFGGFHLTYIAHYNTELISKSVFIDPCCFCLSHVHLPIGLNTMTFFQILKKLIANLKCYRETVKHISMLLFRGVNHQYLIRNTTWYMEQSLCEPKCMDSRMLVMCGQQDPMINGAAEQKYFTLHHPHVKFLVKTGWSHGSFLFPYNVGGALKIIEAHLRDKD